MASGSTGLPRWLPAPRPITRRGQCPPVCRQCRCCPKPPACANNRGFRSPPCRRRTGALHSPAGIQCLRPPRSARAYTPHRDTPKDTARSRRAGRRHPASRRAATVQAAGKAVLFGCAPSCAPGTALCPRCRSKDQTAARGLLPGPQAQQAAGPGAVRGCAACRRFFARKTRCGGAARQGPRRPASGRPYPRCSRSRPAARPSYAARAAVCRGHGRRGVSRPPGLHKAAHTAASLNWGPIRSWSLSSSGPIKKSKTGHFLDARKRYNRSIPCKEVFVNRFAAKK